AVVNELDRPQLVEEKFQAQIREIQTPTAARKKSPGPTADFGQLDAAAQLDLLTQLYTKNFGAEPKFPESIAAIKTKPEITAAKIEFLGRELHQHTPISA